MIQNNLRDIDAGMDVDAYVDMLEEFGADTCMVGCGGITSFYPTKLSCQKASPYLKDDFFGNLLARCHERQIRVIARFDFSKTHIGFVEGHPDWFSRTGDGEPVLFHDTAATCVNGPYQQECSLEILREAMTQYQLDGVFFNMFGYQTKDYAGRYVGICQCKNCREKFRAYSGHELPKEEEGSDPVYRKYQEFRRASAEALLERIYYFVKDLNPEVAVCTYSNRHVDLVRNESNSALDRPYPFWAMASEANTSCVQDTFEDRYSSNCVINAVDIFYRFMGVSPYLNELRLYGDLAAGGNLDWCIIGGFETYPDKRNFAGVKRAFGLHKKYGKYYSQMKSCARILLVKPEGGGMAEKEYLGLYRMLKEAHLQFDLVDGRETEILAEKAEAYQTILLPGIRTLPGETVEAFKRSAAVLVGTGLAFQEDPELLRSLFSVRLKRKLEPVRGSYMLAEPKQVFRNFSDRDWVYLDGDYYYMEPDPKNRNYMPLISAGVYGPPERCFGYEVTEQGCVSVQEGRSIYFPWRPGLLYYSQGYEEFKELFLDVLRADALPADMPEIKAPPCAEVFFHCCGKEQYLLQILNYSGFNGTTFYEPLPVLVECHFPGMWVERAQLLREDGKHKVACTEPLKVTCKGLYQAVLLTGRSR